MKQNSHRSQVKLIQTITFLRKPGFKMLDSSQKQEDNIFVNLTFILLFLRDTDTERLNDKKR